VKLDGGFAVPGAVPLGDGTLLMGRYPQGSISAGHLGDEDRRLGRLPLAEQDGLVTIGGSGGPVS
jgi:hypothetical protein